MIRIQIGTDERYFGQHGVESWIVEQIQKRRKNGAMLNMRVHIKHGDIDMVLTTPGAPTGGGGGRAFRSLEEEIYSLWLKCGLGEMDFTHGNLISFLAQIKALVS
ncbi:hypothetical protein QA601_15345 [Chitinispirillales bacterium ANBcel5]|uniref:hypothetical protein n=1 Tax=Cellulosispirillum alkaliphilum TaxID=3039283 RepID=UPI002A51921A|nr:hypothetical protein [Chitinispirillales bacterium ANBcel5]